VAATAPVRGADAATVDPRSLPRTGNGRGLTGAAGVLLLIGGFGVGFRRPVRHAGR
jgi:LPXTG-motif cell wall-anchored protein